MRNLSWSIPILKKPGCIYNQNVRIGFRDAFILCKGGLYMKDNELKYGYGVTHTLEETARFMGVTRECVRQIEKRALEKIRRQLKLRYGITNMAGIL